MACKCDLLLVWFIVMCFLWTLLGCDWGSLSFFSSPGFHFLLPLDSMCFWSRRKSLTLLFFSLSSSRPNHPSPHQKMEIGSKWCRESQREHILWNWSIHMKRSRWQNGIREGEKKVWPQRLFLPSELHALNDNVERSAVRYQFLSLPQLVYHSLSLSSLFRMKTILVPRYTCCSHADQFPSLPFFLSLPEDERLWRLYMNLTLILLPFLSLDLRSRLHTLREIRSMQGFLSWSKIEQFLPLPVHDSVMTMKVSCLSWMSPSFVIRSSFILMPMDFVVVSFHFYPWFLSTIKGFSSILRLRRKRQILRYHHKTVLRSKKSSFESRESSKRRSRRRSRKRKESLGILFFRETHQN